MARSSKRPKAEDPVLADLPRGAWNSPHRASMQYFPTSEQIASEARLVYRDGTVFCGVTGSPMSAHNDQKGGPKKSYATGGTLCGTRDDRHCVLVAPARSGKGRCHLIPLLLTYSGSIVVIDIKGDLASETAAFRAVRLGDHHQVWVLDPYSAASSAVERYRSATTFNPLSRIDPEDEQRVVDTAVLTASSLVTRQATGEPHWDDIAEQAIAGVVAHVLTWPLHTEKRDLGMVAWLLSHAASPPDANTPSDLEAEMRSNPAAGGFVQAMGAALFDKADRELSGALSTIRRHLNWLHQDKMRRSVEGEGIDLTELQTQPTTLYVSLPVRYLSSCTGWLRLVLNSALAAFEAGEARREYQIQSAQRPPCILLIDEMPALGYMRSLEIAAGQIAGLGVKLYCCAQDLSQLQAAYPKSWHTFLANSGTSTFFAPQDTTTLEWIERRLGQTTIVQSSRSDGSWNALVREGSSGRSATTATHPVMTGAEAARVFSREDPWARQLVLTASDGPLILQRAAYDQHPAFRSLLATPTT